MSDRKTIYTHPEEIVAQLEERLAFLQKKIKQLEEENSKWRQKAEALKIELESLENK